MSMHPQPIQAIPEETFCVAHVVLPEGNVWLQMRDEVGTICEDSDLFKRNANWLNKVGFFEYTSLYSAMYLYLYGNKHPKKISGFN